jgi:thioredoxin-related protein
VIVDLDRKRSPAQQELVKNYYLGYIPHVVVLDSTGKALYNSPGEAEESKIANILDKLL